MGFMPHQLGGVKMEGLMTEKLAVVAAIDPDAYGTGTQGTDWADMEKFGQVMFVVMAGALGSSATLDFKVQEATDSSGTGAQDISGKSITQLTDAGTDSDKQAIVNVIAEELDRADGYRYVRGLLTVGTATSDAGVLVLAGDPRFLPASDFDLASVDEIVT
jgi:hypothetical protein